MTVEEIVEARSQGDREFAVWVEELGKVVPALVGSRHGDRFIVVPTHVTPRPVPAPRYVVQSDNVLERWSRYVDSGIERLLPGA